MKKYFLMVLALTFFLFASSVFAHGLESKTVENIVSEILSSQNTTNIKQLDCNKISSAQFSNLGDAVMERMVGNHELYEQMDLMMGGEGSDSLQTMHMIVGKNWLNCNGSFQGMMDQGSTMGFNTMSMMMRMMGNYYPDYYSGYNSLLFFTIIGWILSIILVLILTTFVATGRIKIQKRRK